MSGNQILTSVSCKSTQKSWMNGHYLAEVISAISVKTSQKQVLKVIDVQFFIPKRSYPCATVSRITSKVRRKIKLILC